MSTPPATADRRSGLVNVFDIIVAPGAAFERLRIAPSWGWAFLVASLLGIAGFLLMEPAQLHALDKTGPAMYAAMPQIAKLPPDKQAAMIEQNLKFAHIGIQLGPLFVPVIFLLGGLLSSIFMLIGNAIGGGDGSFKKFFALSMTLNVIGGLGLLLTGIIVMLRGADNFETQAAIQRALPSLAILAPGAPLKLAAFLGSLNIAALWSTALSALGMIAVARIKPPVAWTVAIIVLLGSALLAASFAQ